MKAMNLKSVLTGLCFFMAAISGTSQPSTTKVLAYYLGRAEELEKYDVSHKTKKSYRTTDTN